jgi:hypothetical protein
MARELTTSERSAFFWRHPSLVFEIVFLPPEGKLVKDEILSCVLLFKTTDNYLLTIKADDIYGSSCTWNVGPGKLEAAASEFVDSVGQRIQTLPKDFLDYLQQLVILAVIILIVYFIASGNAEKFVRSFK